MVRASKDAVTVAAQPPARTSATFASAATVQAPTTFALALKSDCVVCYPEVRSVRRTGPVDWLGQYRPSASARDRRAHLVQRLKARLHQRREHVERSTRRTPRFEQLGWW